ncbi:MAG TPA: glycerol-3-phosphate dehydrogenase/oxidase [Bacteroidetes bacterium]|nr:glycerol-3-phosphate dehydrogenase/oxidase [Bacteroidota bacterium]
MKRNVARLAAQQYDVIIIGGGIYGAWAAWDAALRGLTVALLEKEDFGGATSSNSLKIIHGGLRYLQHADIKRMRESIHERAVLMRIAPQYVHPLPCVMPTYGHGIKGREVMRIALFLNDLIGFDRNRGAAPQKFMPRGGVLSKKELLNILPGIDENKLTGGALWYDCQVYNSERLLISVLRGAANKGAELANYAPVTGFLRRGNRIEGVRVRDALENRDYDVRGKIVLNAAGPWINKTLGLADAAPEKPFKLSKAMNLVVRRQLIARYGAGIPSKYEFKDADAVINKGSRLLFFTPWRHYTLIGTTHVPYEGDPDDFAITEEDITTFLDEFNAAYPAKAVQREDICHVYGGLLPMDGVAANGRDVTLSKHYRLIDHARQDELEGLVSLLGVKYTTARDVATRSVDLLCKKLQQKQPTRTEETPIPGGDIPSFDTYLEEEKAKRAWGLAPQTIEHLIYNYGTLYPQVLAAIDDNPALAGQACEHEQVVLAEILHGVREEMAINLRDAMMRRTELASAGFPGEQALQRAARVMAAELGWDEEETERQKDKVREVFGVTAGEESGHEVAA